MSKNFNSKAFSECLHTTFRIHFQDGNPLPAELVEVTEKNFSPKAEQFSVVFRRPGNEYFPQGIYRVEHEKLGEIELFLVPLAPDEEGPRYEAVFSRFRTKDEM